MLIKELLTTIYNRRLVPDKKPSVTTKEYYSLLRYYGPPLAKKFGDLSITKVEIEPGFSLPHEITAFINFAIAKFVDPNRVINADRPDYYFQRMLNNEVASYFRAVREDSWIKSIRQELLKENTLVFLFERGSKSFFQDWWGAFAWKQDNIEKNKNKCQYPTIYDILNPSPFWKVISEKKDTGEIIRVYSLYLIESIDAYLRFNAISDVIQEQFGSFELQFENDSNVLHNKPTSEEFDPFVVENDIHTVINDLREKFILFGHACKFPGVKIAEHSQNIEKSDWGKRNNFSGFERQTENNCWKRIKQDLDKLGYSTPVAMDLIAELLEKDIPPCFNLNTQNIGENC